MDPEASLSSTESTHRTEFVALSLLAISITFGGKKPAVLAVVNNNGEEHYTEERLTIPETLASRVVPRINNMVGKFPDHTKPGQAGAASRVFVS